MMSSKLQLKLGHPESRLCFYLPNPPILPEHLQLSLSKGQPLGEIIIRDHGNNLIDEIIALNGNHWRKIFTIIAKLSTTSDDWREYRHQLFSQTQESLVINAFEPTSGINTSISHKAFHQWHIICGRQCAQQLSLPPAESQSVAQISNNTLVVPYLDYRQFPNHLIAKVRHIIHDDEVNLPSNR